MADRCCSAKAVLAAAGLVAATASPWPDIIAGGAIALVFLRSAVQVIRAALPVVSGARGGDQNPRGHARR